MGFNLTTFLAQIVNLFLLIWLLKRFLYRPVLDIIDKRRHEIEHDVQEAADKLSAAEQTQKNLAQQQQDYDNLRQKRLNDLDCEIQNQKQTMLKELDQQRYLKLQKIQDDLNHTWASAQADVRDMIGSAFMSLSRKVLNEWFDKVPMDQVLNLFEEKLRNLSPKKQKELQTILTHQKQIQIQTSEALNNTQRNSLKKALNKMFDLSPKTRILFKTKTDLILGIEMRLGDFLIDWNLNTYLEEMNQHLKQNISGLVIPDQRKANE